MFLILLLLWDLLGTLAVKLDTPLRKKCPYLKWLWPVFSRTRTEYGDTEYLYLFTPKAGKCGPEWLWIRTLFTHCPLSEDFFGVKEIWKFYYQYILQSSEYARRQKNLNVKSPATHIFRLFSPCSRLVRYHF